MPEPPAVGAPAPDYPLADPQSNHTTLRKILQDKIVVLVFYVGYT
jgi:peroxiredoxin